MEKTESLSAPAAAGIGLANGQSPGAGGLRLPLAGLRAFLSDLPGEARGPPAPTKRRSSSFVAKRPTQAGYACAATPQLVVQCYLERRSVNRTSSALVAVALLIPAAFAKDKPKKGPDDIGNGDPGKGVNLYSMEREIALGRQMALEVERESRQVYDPTVAEYVNRLGQNLVRNSDAKVPFTIKV